MKKIETPIVKVIELKSQDVITTSGEVIEGNVDPNGTADGLGVKAIKNVDNVW